MPANHCRQHVVIMRLSEIPRGTSLTEIPRLELFRERHCGTSSSQPEAAYIVQEFVILLVVVGVLCGRCGMELIDTSAWSLSLGQGYAIS